MARVLHLLSGTQNGCVIWDWPVGPLAEFDRAATLPLPSGWAVVEYGPAEAPIFMRRLLDNLLISGNGELEFLGSPVIAQAGDAIARGKTPSSDQGPLKGMRLDFAIFRVSIGFQVSSFNIRS